MSEQTTIIEKKSRKFYTAYDRPPTKKSYPGDKIYKYSYIDPKTKKVEKAEDNIFAHIQSVKDKVDYKKMIKEGMFNYEGNDSGFYGDVSELQTGTVDNLLLSEFIGSLTPEEVQTILEQRNETSVEGSQEQEVVTEGTQETTEESTTPTPTPNPTPEGTGGNE